MWNWIYLNGVLQDKIRKNVHELEMNPGGSGLFIIRMRRTSVFDVVAKHHYSHLIAQGPTLDVPLPLISSRVKTWNPAQLLVCIY